ncbi:MAG: CehA/McbA family metallohydrolase [Gemmatimonadales bacterium]
MRAAALLLPLALATPLAAQWTNRYPKIASMGHHVYLEGYELPTLTIGPMDPAIAPDGRTVAIASRGWLWLLDLGTGAARRLTDGAGIDSRPTWSPDGSRVAFVRDDTRQLTIVERVIATGAERVLVNEPAITLDPAYAPDGRTLYYSSAIAGDLDIWQVDLAGGRKTRVTQAPGLELQPVPLRDGSLAYVAKAAANEVRIRDASGGERTMLSGPILSMLRIAAAPDGRALALTRPAGDASSWELALYPADGVQSPIFLTRGHGMPLAPAWSPDGRNVYYSEADDRQMMRLYRMPADGGRPAEVAVTAWDWGAPTGRVRITTRQAGTPGAAPSRLAVTDATGHPLVADEGQPRFDGQNGIVFFYSAGVTDIEAPLGDVTVQAVSGLATPPARRTVRAVGGTVVAADVTLEPVWDARAAGWFSGDHHFHLNYGGPYRLTPAALAPMGRAEALDVMTPLLANLHTRFEDQDLFTWRDVRGEPLIFFGQEVRSHFLGHIGLIGTDELFWPWIWGPGYELHGRDDRTNADVLAFAHRQGGIGTYVHPATSTGQVPPELVADGVLGLFDTIELACLWSDELGAVRAWYPFLNLGVPIAISAGTDVMNNFYRTMAVGTTRVYVKADPAQGYRGYLAALKAGRSFVSTGPLLEFAIDGQEPGQIISRGLRTVNYELTVHTAMAVDSVDLVVNGETAVRLGPVAVGSRQFRGELAIPVGGWVAARALGGPTAAWPAMNSYPFAHTAPVWIGRVGSTTADSRQAAARKLTAMLDEAVGRLRQGYRGVPIPRLEAHFAAARARLDSLGAR